MVIFESGLPRERIETISITDDNPKIWWQSNEVYSWPQPPLISHRKCTGRNLASAASYLLLSSSKVYHLIDNEFIYSIDKTNLCREHIQYFV